MARYFRRGKSKVRFLPAVANAAAPTAGELTAGTDLTVSIADIAGFGYNNGPIATPDLNSTFTSSIPGEDTTDDSSITFYDDDTSTTIRTLLAKGVSGYIMRMPYGQVTAKRAEIWPVTSTGVNDTWSTGNDAAQFQVGFAITATPTLTSVVP
jgi:hypothetical protein